MQGEEPSDVSCKKLLLYPHKQKDASRVVNLLNEDLQRHESALITFVEPRGRLVSEAFEENDAKKKKKGEALAVEAHAEVGSTLP